MKQLFLFITVLNLLHCSSPQEKETVELRIFKASSIKQQKLELECKYIPLETSDSVLINSIGQVLIVKDHIYILEKASSPRVFCFDINGRFVEMVGQNGQGPGEYTLVNKLFLDQEKRAIVVADVGRKQLLYYDLNNRKFRFSENTPEFSEIQQLDGNYRAWHSVLGYSHKSRKKYNLMISFGQDNELIALADETGFTSGYSIGLGQHFHSCKDQHYIVYRFDPVVRNISAKGSVPAYQIQFGHGELPPIDYIKDESANDRKYTTPLLKSDFIVAFTLEETSSHINLFYLKKSQFYIGFYDKKMRQGWDSPLITFSQETGLLGLASIVGTYDDYFISFLHSQSLLHVSPLRNDLQDLARTIKEDDNPVLCLFKFK